MENVERYSVNHYLETQKHFSKLSDVELLNNKGMVRLEMVIRYNN